MFQGRLQRKAEGATSHHGEAIHVPPLETIDNECTLYRVQIDSMNARSHPDSEFTGVLQIKDHVSKFSTTVSPGHGPVNRCSCALLGLVSIDPSVDLHATLSVTMLVNTVIKCFWDVVLFGDVADVLGCLGCFTQALLRLVLLH